MPAAKPRLIICQDVPEYIGTRLSDRGVVFGKSRYIDSHHHYRNHCSKGGQAGLGAGRYPVADVARRELDSGLFLGMFLTPYCEVFSCFGGQAIFNIVKIARTPSLPLDQSNETGPALQPSRWVLNLVLIVNSCLEKRWPQRYFSKMGQRFLSRVCNGCPAIRALL